MFGYACDETAQFMPMPIWLSHRLMERQSYLRKDGRLPWLRPDAKAQVTLKYKDHKPHSIDTVVLSIDVTPNAWCGAPYAAVAYGAALICLAIP